MNGFGTFNWPDGRSYEGNYLNDEKDGHGIFCLANGSKYIGNWKHGVPDGIGFLTPPPSLKTEKPLKAEWVNGHRVRWL
jgi:hypothetical protein